MNDLTSGSSFYSEPHPERIGSPVLQDTQGSLDNVIDISTQATPPPYTQEKFASQDSASFAPATSVMDPSFQPDIQPAPQPTGIPMWMVLAAGALLVLYLRDQ